jgi:uncharacterized protein YegL
MSSWPGDQSAQFLKPGMVERVVLADMGLIDDSDQPLQDALDAWRSHPSNRKFRQHAAQVFARIAVDAVIASQQSQPGALAELGNEIINFIALGNTRDLEKRTLAIMTRAAEQRLKVTGLGTGPDEDENRYFMTTLEQWIQDDPAPRLKYLKARLAAAMKPAPPAPAPGASPAKPATPPPQTRPAWADPKLNLDILGRSLLLDLGLIDDQDPTLSDNLSVLANMPKGQSLKNQIAEQVFGKFALEVIKLASTPGIQPTPSQHLADLGADITNWLSAQGCDDIPKTAQERMTRLARRRMGVTPPGSQNDEANDAYLFVMLFQWIAESPDARAGRLADRIHQVLGLRPAGSATSSASGGSGASGGPGASAGFAPAAPNIPQPPAAPKKPKNAPPKPDPTRGIAPVLQIPLDPEPTPEPTPEATPQPTPQPTSAAPTTPKPAPGQPATPFDPLSILDEILQPAPPQPQPQSQPQAQRPSQPAPQLEAQPAPIPTPPPSPAILDPNLRRLPVYLLLDCSGSMSGDPIESMRAGVRSLTSDLKSDPQAIETAWLSVIAFGSTASQLTPLTDLMSFQEPHMEAQGITSLGAALTLLDNCISREVRTPDHSQKGDWMPLVFVMTDGLPTDAWELPAKNLLDNNRANIIACAAGSNADAHLLKQLSPHVVELHTLQPDALKSFFQWASAAVKSTAASPNPSAPPQDNALPPPPPNINIVP